MWHATVLTIFPDMSPAELGAYIGAEIDKWGGVVKAANIKAE